MAVGGVVAGHELSQVVAAERVGLEGEILVGAQVVDPQVFGPGGFAGGFALEEQHVGFDALGVEDAGGQAQQGVHIALGQQFVSDGFARAAVLLEDGAHMLHEVELFVAGGGPEVFAHDVLVFAAHTAFVGDEGDAGLFAEGRVGEHHVEVAAGVAGQAVGHADGGGFAADAVQVEVHHAQAGGVIHDLPAVQGAGVEVRPLVAVERVVGGHVLAHGHPAPGEEVHGGAVLHAPAAGGQQAVNVLSGAGFGCGHRRIPRGW